MTPSYLNIRGSYATQAAMMSARHPIVTMRRAVPVRKSTWGPYLWKFFHSVGYRLANISTLEERCAKTREIWEHTQYLINTIPCPSCRKHATTEYVSTKYKDPDDKTCDWYQRWAFQFHNKVNTRLRKSTVSWEDSVKISSSLDPSSQLQAYVKSINGWKYNRMDSVVTKIENVLKTI